MLCVSRPSSCILGLLGREQFAKGIRLPPVAVLGEGSLPFYGHTDARVQ